VFAVFSAVIDSCSPTEEIKDDQIEILREIAVKVYGKSVMTSLLRPKAE